MLGSNDMKPCICGQAIGAKQGMERLVEIVRGHRLSAGCRRAARADRFAAAAFRDGQCRFRRRCSTAASRSRRSWPRLYAALADEVGCGFFDAGSVAETTPLDGVHLDAENTRAIGEALAPVVRVMLEL